MQDELTATLQSNGQRLTDWYRHLTDDLLTELMSLRRQCRDNAAELVKLRDAVAPYEPPQSESAPQGAALLATLLQPIVDVLPDRHYRLSILEDGRASLYLTDAGRIVYGIDYDDLVKTVCMISDGGGFLPGGEFFIRSV